MFTNVPLTYSDNSVNHGCLLCIIIISMIFTSFFMCVSCSFQRGGVIVILQCLHVSHCLFELLIFH